MHLSSAFGDDRASLGAEHDAELDSGLGRAHGGQPAGQGMDSWLDPAQRRFQRFAGPRNRLTGTQRRELKTAGHVII